ncbi:hypothetical protein [Tsuneonella sp. HG222]
MRLTLLLAGAAAMTLAACDSSAPEPAATETAVVAAETGDAASPTPVPSASETALPTTIPTAFQGRFGLVAADCTSTMGDAKGLLEVSGDKLKFYESVGTLTALTDATVGRIKGDFAFTGEGMEWERQVVMDLRDNGKVLVRREFGEGASPEAFTYTRCA